MIPTEVIRHVSCLINVLLGGVQQIRRRCHVHHTAGFSVVVLSHDTKCGDKGDFLSDYGMSVFPASLLFFFPRITLSLLW